MSLWQDVGVMIPEMWLPSPEVDPAKYAVIACDQHTAEPEYWQQVDALVGDAPSTLKLTYPEVFLTAPDREQRITGIEQTMDAYLEQGLLKRQRAGMMLVKRQVGQGYRWGLVLAIDLENYDYRPGAKALIRATEDTILSRIPPRAAIRCRAAMEFPHVLLLIDDPDDTVIGPLASRQLPIKYDFELMLGGGRITGYQVLDELKPVHDALKALGETFRREVDAAGDPMIFAVGDGNHSLATAKACWEDVKQTLPQGVSHPARYALVEVVNLHDPALTFEPIHRVVFGRGETVMKTIRQSLKDQGITITDCTGWQDAMEIIGSRRGFAMGQQGCFQVATLKETDLPAAVLQKMLDKLGLGEMLDYVHGDKTAAELGAKPGNCCFLLPALNKADLFPAVSRYGVLPRKTFSMGHTQEKRYYMEGRSLLEIDKV